MLLLYTTYDEFSAGDQIQVKRPITAGSWKTQTEILS